MLRQYVAQKYILTILRNRLRKLAFDLKFGPATWFENIMVGEKFYRSFMKRNPSLPVRVAQAISLSTVTNYNKINVKVFFNAIHKLLWTDTSVCHRIFLMLMKLASLRIKTWKSSSKMWLTARGSFTLNERGTLVTGAFAVIIYLFFYSFWAILFPIFLGTGKIDWDCKSFMLDAR